jgi:Domain of unknown function (DUF1905)
LTETDQEQLLSPLAKQHSLSGRFSFENESQERYAGKRNLAMMKNMMKKTFRAKLQKSPNKGGWTYVVWPESAKFFGTRGLVKVQGRIEGHPFRASFMAMGGGRHMLPVKAEIREAIGKDVGDVVTVTLEERVGSAKPRPKSSGSL